MDWSCKIGVWSNIAAIATVIYFAGLFVAVIYYSYTGEFNKNVINQRSFAVIVWPFKYKKLKYRFLPIVYLFRKTCSTLIIIYGTSNPNTQSLLTTINYFIYWYYIFLFNPMRKELKLVKVLLVTVESEMMLLHIWYYITVISSDPNSMASEVELTKWNMYIMMLLMATYVAFSLGMVIKILYLFIRDKSANRQKNPKTKKINANDSSVKKFKNNSSEYAKGKQSNLEFSFDEKQAGQIDLNKMQQLQ